MEISTTMEWPFSASVLQCQRRSQDLDEGGAGAELGARRALT